MAASLRATTVVFHFRVFDCLAAKIPISAGFAVDLFYPVSIRNSPKLVILQTRKGMIHCKYGSMDFVSYVVLGE
jgi:hypothetical protein